MDRLPAIAPINSIALGRSRKRKRGETDEVSQQDIALAYGRGNAGGLAFVTKQFEPRTAKTIKYEGAHRVWCFSSAGKQTGKDKPFDDMAIISQATSDGVGKSSLLKLDDGDLSPVAYSEFDEAAGSTISITRLKTTNHTIQVLPTEVRVYDIEFALSQIFPIVDEEEGQISKATKAAFADPYLAVIKEDGTMTLLKADKAGELDEVELPDVFTSRSISSVSLYTDTQDFFQASRFYSGGTSQGPVLAALTSEGHFCMLSLPNISIQLFQCDSLPFLPTYLMQDLQLPKHWRNKDELSEILLADLGDETSLQPFLVLRNVTGDVVLYEPFAIPEVVGSFKFTKVATKPAQDAEDQTDEDGYQSTKPPMEVLQDFGGHASVIVPGFHPFVILKQASTMPHIYELAAVNMRSVSPVNLSMCTQGFAFVDDQHHISYAEVPDSMMIGQADWAIKRIPLGQEISSIAYFEPTESYVLATNYPTEFQLPQDDEWHPEWQTETTRFLPTTLQSSLKLLSSKSHSIISQYHFDACERILCLKCLNLEISEETHERKDLIVVGTAIVKGENVTTRGNIYIFDVVEVVPEPDVPESDVKLKLITKEDVRGAVSALCDVGSQGFVLAAQGQKCMVRGLKEDMSILPVAFLDMRYYVHVAKELRGTGLCILGDAFSGLWLVGYSEEPYKLQIIGRDLENPPVLAAEFLPSGKELFIISADESGVLRVLQFDPEDPKAERGTKLLLRSTFNAGATPTQMLLLPPTAGAALANSDLDDMDLDGGQQSGGLQRILVSTQSGSLCMLTTLPDAAYRRLSTLQNTLLTTLDFQPCSLNPRAYRQVETDGVGGRGVIDGNFVRRWWETSTQQRVASADKAGGSVWEVRGDMGLVSGDDLGI